MALFGSLFGGGEGAGDPLDLYGDLFTDKQKAALRQRELSQGLLGFAAKLGAASAPSPVPKGSFLGLLGQAAGGFASQGDEQALKGMEIAEKVRSARQERAVLAKVTPIVEAITRQLIQGGVPAAQAAQIAPQIATQVAAPQGGSLASNAPPPPPAPQPSTGIGVPEGMPPGGAAGAEWLPNLPSGGQSGAPPALLPIPPAPPGGRITPADYGVPGQQSLLPRPPGANPQMGGTLSADLYGGGTESPLPFDLASARPTGDNPGGLPDLGQIQLELLSGQAAPVLSDETLRKTSPVPSLGGAARPASAWQQGYTYDQPRVPYGQASEDRARPGGRPDDARLDALTRQYESGDRNIMQQVNATSTAGGYYQITNPTWRDIAPRAGIDLEKYPTAISAPREVQAAAAKALRETRGMQPWASNKPLMAAVGGNLPDVGRVRVEPLGGEAAAAGGSGIAGTGVTPEALAALNAMLKLGGIKSDPFGSLLDAYYKSPGYIAEKARTEATEQKKIGLEYDPKIEAAKAAATQKYIQENATHESGLKLANDLIGKGVYLNKETGRMEPIKNAAQALAEIDRVKELNKSDLALVDTTLTFPGENQPRTVQMTGAQARAIAEGREVQVGGVTIPAMTGIKLGKPVPSEEDKAGIQARGAAQTEMYKSGLKALDTAHDAVRGANQRAPYYGSMLAAMEGFKPGATAEMRLTGMQYLKDMNIIKGDSVPQGEALKLAGERLAFLAVPPNQGSWSNIERQSLKSSIPGMATSPEGLAEAIKLMQQLDDYDRKVSTIHRQVADKNGGLPNMLEAQRQIEALGPPLSAQQEAALERLRQPATAPSGDANATKPANEIIQNGWRYDATTHKPIGPVQ